ncbi:bifunctional hydroxymethylpyrimidine kinase/phosphomethylpyrimidine kinase, partial [bacterium]|nr:bifunctional hydroxymethylpyrimidine kinase/phosphomethylpyrimidine kinase [bacterium]
MDLSEAVEEAKLYVTDAIRFGLEIGSGHGPTDHFFFLRS